MKRTLKFLFAFVVMLLFAGDVFAKQKLICRYETSFGNDLEIFYDREYELHLILNDDVVTIDKLILTSSPSDIDDCLEKANTEILCEKKITDITQKAELDGITLKEGDDCLDLLYFQSNGKIYIDKNYGANLVNQTKTSNKVYCGGEQQGRITGIPKKIPELTSSAITIIQIAIPIILVMLGTLDLFKGITAGKEDEIKKGQQLFIKRLAVAAVVFFVVIIVKFFISVVADTNQTNMVDCIDCFISNDCEEDFS